MKTFVPGHHDGNVPLRHCSSPFLSQSKCTKASITIIIIFTIAAFFGFILFNSPYYSFRIFERIRPSSRESSSSQQYGPVCPVTDEMDCKSYNKSDYKRRYPQALIMGARKGGTRALIDFLTIHSKIVAAEKEVHFYDWQFNRGMMWYLTNMPESYPDQVTMEKSPNYLVSAPTPQRIHKFFPSVKLILTLTNPVERALSDYLQLKEDKGRPAYLYTFENLVTDRKTGRIKKSYIAIERSLYSVHLKRWLKYFNMSQILVIDGENLKRRPWEELYKVEEFLAVDHELQESRFVFNSTKGFFCFNKLQPNSQGKVEEKCLVKGKGRPHPWMDPMVREKLQEFLRPYNEILFKQIGRRFNWY